MILAPTPTIEDAEQYLLSVQNEDGGWPYSQGLPSQPEPTAFSLLALARTGVHAKPIQDGLNYLSQLQDSTGAIRVPGAFAKSYWPTALVVIVFQQLRSESPLIQKALAWLFAQRTKTTEMNEELARDFEIDTSLVGWSWTENTFSWVDPTAWVVLALRHCGHLEHPRTQEALKLLLDRAYEEGGANCGNRRIYGSMTEPVPGNTCTLLLAHSALEDHPKLKAARCYLRESILRHTDLEHLCWIRLALDAWKEEPETAEVLAHLEELLLQYYQEQTDKNRVFRRSVMRQALTILALSADAYRPL
ncbi:MAG TPA: terpene cyclase/mutase family protein, partial [Gemmatales bacterium]|nr:terpene cyclase/mutase family protein [Gemmatales bacterium]